MRIVTYLFIAVCFVCASGIETYYFEQLNHFGLGTGRRSGPIPPVFDLSSGARPQPLPPEPPSPKQAIATPYKTLYQGARVPNDTRVFRRKFEYNPQTSGHQVICRGLFECSITHLSIETSEAIPIVLRGGVGYRHFSVIVRAKPGRALKGQVKAYCRHRDLVDTPAIRSMVQRHRRLYNETTPPPVPPGSDEN